MSPVVRILGVGSPFGLDQIGWWVVEGLDTQALATRFPHLDISTENCDRPGALLLERLDGADMVVLVDALVGGGSAGAVFELGIRQLLEGGAGFTSSHCFGVAEALRLGSAMGVVPEKTVVIGVDIGQGLGETLLPEWVDRALTSARLQVARAVDAAFGS